MKKIIILSGLVGLLGLFLIAKPAVATFTCSGTPVRTVFYNFTTRDNAMNGPWATDYFQSKVEIYHNPVPGHPNRHCIVRTDEGTFETDAALSPGGDSVTTVSAGVKGTISGGETAIVYGILKTEAELPNGSTVTKDWRSVWTLEKRAPYYEPFFFWLNPAYETPTHYAGRGSVQEGWNWTYATCNNGTWVDNAETETAWKTEKPNALMGDITGDYIPCSTPETPHVDACAGKGDIDGHPCGYSPNTNNCQEYRPSSCTASLPKNVRIDKLERIDATTIKIWWTKPEGEVTKYALTYGYEQHNLPMGIPEIDKGANMVMVSGLRPNTKTIFELWAFNSNECAARSERVWSQ